MSIKIEKQENGLYYVRVWSRHKDIFGKRKTKSKSNISGIVTAKKIATMLENEISEDKFSSDMNFQTLLNLYNSKNSDISPTTQYNNKFLATRALNFFGKIPIEKINTLLMQEYADKLTKEGLKKSTVKRNCGYVTAILNWAVAYDILEFNRIKRIKIKEDDTPFSPTLLNISQIGEVLKWLKSNYYNLYIPILLDVCLGTRRGESLGLKWENVDFDNNVIRIKNNIVQAGNSVIEKSKLKSSSSNRVLGMSHFLKKELQEHSKFSKCVSEYVCANVFTGDVQTPSNVSKKFHNIMLQHFNIDMRLHDLRHTFNQLAYESNIDLSTRSKLLGHSSEAITNNVYTHFSIEKSTDAMNIISNKIQNSI